MLSVVLRTHSLAPPPLFPSPLQPLDEAGTLDASSHPKETPTHDSCHAACLQLHPDRHAASPPEVRALAEELFKVLSAAFVDYRALPGSPGLSC